MAKRALSLAAVVWCVACGGGAKHEKPASETSGAEQPPAPTPAPKVDLEALLSQETEVLPTHEVATADGKLKAKMEASAAPMVTPGDGFTQLIAPFGEHAMQCFVYPSAKDAGEVLRLLSDGTLKEAAPEHRWVDVHGNQAGGWPYVIARAHYWVNGPEGKLIGDYKIAVSMRGQTTATCLMDAPGQYASFERALGVFLSSLDSAENRTLPKVDSAEVTRTRIEGRMVGISQSASLKDGKDTVTRRYSTQMYIAPDGSLHTSDEASTETFHRGKLQKGSYASASMGELAYSLELSSNKQKYQVKGTVQDKPVEAEFEVKGGILDSEHSNALACEVQQGKKPRVEMLEYTPSANPTGPTPFVVEKSPTADADLLATVGEKQAAQMLMHVDDKCEVERGTLKIGAVSLELERLWHVENKS
jgi:hypothetical protein